MRPEDQITVTYFNKATEADLLWDLYRDPKYKDFFRSFGPHWNKESLCDSDSQAGVIFYTVRYLGKFIGMVCLSEIHAFARSGNLGIVLLDKYQDQRAGKEHKLCFLVMRKVAESLFEEQNFNRVVCKIATHRDDLMENLLNAHFIFEGQLEQSVFTDGEFKNEYQLSLLAEDYFKHIKPKNTPRKAVSNGPRS